MLCFLLFPKIKYERKIFQTDLKFATIKIDKLFIGIFPCLMHDIWIVWTMFRTRSTEAWLSRDSKYFLRTFNLQPHGEQKFPFRDINFYWNQLSILRFKLSKEFIFSTMNVLQTWNINRFIIFIIVVRVFHSIDNSLMLLWFS